jgi:NADPH2:quinone reductase
MKAVTVGAFGGPEGLLARDCTDPVAEAGEVIVAIEAAGVGYVDVMARRGQYIFAEPGFIPGLEITGRVISVGEGVSASWLGRRVLALPARGGGYAEAIAMRASDLIPLPDDITSEAALAVGVNGLVAAISLDRAHLSSGDRVLIRGAGGGIGIWATQLAARIANDVTATTSSEERGTRLAALGATTLWNRHTEPLHKPLHFDVIIDTIGGPDTPSCIAMLRPNGRYVMCGGIEGAPPVDFGMALMKRFHLSLSFATLSLNSLSSTALAARFTPLMDALGRGELSAVIDSSFALDAASDAHRRLESGQTFGKILLKTTNVRN